MPHKLVEIFTHAHLLDFKNRNSWAGLGQRSVLVDCHVRSEPGRSQRPVLLEAVAETTACTGKEDLKAVRRVRHYKEVDLQEWPLAGQATVLRVLYGIGLCMSLCRRTILSKRLWVPARVNLTIHTFRTVDNRRSSFCSGRGDKLW